MKMKSKGKGGKQMAARVAEWKRRHAIEEEIVGGAKWEWCLREREGGEWEVGREIPTQFEWEGFDYRIALKFRLREAGEVPVGSVVRNHEYTLLVGGCNEDKLLVAGSGWVRVEELSELYPELSLDGGKTWKTWEVHVRTRRRRVRLSALQRKAEAEVVAKRRANPMMERN